MKEPKNKTPKDANRPDAQPSRARQMLLYIIPTMLSNLCFYLFTIIDGIFVGNGVGTDALGAVNLVMPFVMLANALFLLSSVGAISIAAIDIGEGKTERANRVFNQAVRLSFMIGLLLCLSGVLFTDELARLMGAEGVFHPLVCDYLFWYSIFLIPSGLAVLLQGFGRNDGSPMLVSAAVIVSTVVNIFGDWLLIFPIPLGLKGAAIATGFAQVVSFAIMLAHFLRARGIFHFSAVRPDVRMTGEIIHRGLPEAVSNLGAPVTTWCFNQVLMIYLGDIGVNAFSVISYVGSFAMAAFYGVSDGMQPLFGRTYGAGDLRTLHYYLSRSLITATVVSVGVTLLLLVIGEPICALFGIDPATEALTVSVMPRYAWGFVFMAFNVVVSSYLYSTRRTREALILSVLRSFVLNIVIIFLIPHLFGGESVWWALCVYEGLAGIIACVLLRLAGRGREVSLIEEV